jgi:ABC-type nitrate/sulfonate/bicarbonate transport system substrate-binding protein
VRLPWIIFSFLLLPAYLFAQERYLISYGGSAGYQVPIRVAKELGLLDKYRVNAELVAIPGSAKQIDLLLGGGIQFSHTAAVGPISAFLKGADMAIVAGAFNRSPWNIVTHGVIQTPTDLIGKKIAVGMPGGDVELSLILALKDWGVPLQAVEIVPSGDSATRFNALARKEVDAAVLAPPETFTAERKRLRVLANMGRLEPSVPLDVIVTRRSFLQKNRAVVKNFLKAFVESVHLVKTNREKTIGVYQNMLAEDDSPMLAVALYEYYARQFSFPPRVSREGLRITAELLGQRNGFRKRAAEVGRIVDESILDELEREGFFKTLP